MKTKFRNFILVYKCRICGTTLTPVDKVREWEDTCDGHGVSYTTLTCPGCHNSETKEET